MRYNIYHVAWRISSMNIQQHTCRVFPYSFYSRHGHIVMDGFFPTQYTQTARYFAVRSHRLTCPGTISLHLENWNPGTLANCLSMFCWYSITKGSPASMYLDGVYEGLISTIAKVPPTLRSRFASWMILERPSFGTS